MYLYYSLLVMRKFDVPGFYVPPIDFILIYFINDKIQTIIFIRFRFSFDILHFDIYLQLSYFYWYILLQLFKNITKYNCWRLLSSNDSYFYSPKLSIYTTNFVFVSFFITSKHLFYVQYYHPFITFRAIICSLWETEWCITGTISK